MSEVRVVDNTLAGCARQVRLQADGGDFLRAAFVTGNIGDGIPLVLVGVEAVVVGGNLFSVPGPSVGAAPAGARYCGPGKPTFVAPVGSLYSRTGVGPEQRLWINVDGANLWKHIPFAP